LWKAAPRRTAFSSLDYARGCAEAYGLRTRMYLVSRHGIDAAGAIVHWRHRGFFRQIVLPPVTQYSALLIRQPPSEAAVHQRDTPLESLLQTLEKEFFRAQMLVDIADPRPVQWRHWRVEPRFTYRLAPSADKTVWSEATRRTFRNHRANFDIVESPDVAPTIVQLCAASYLRHGRNFPGNQDALLRLITYLGERVRCFVAQQDGAPQAGLAILHDRNTAHYWIAGSCPGPSMTTLIGHVLSHLHASGIAIFDFVGANTPSIAEFKRRFGPDLVPYYYLSRRV